MATKRQAGTKSKKSARRRARLGRPAGGPPRRVRKNMDMDPAKLAAVKAILGAHTETEAVDRAFDEIIFEHKVTAGLDRLTEAGGLPNVDPDA